MALSGTGLQVAPSQNSNWYTDPTGAVDTLASGDVVTITANGDWRVGSYKVVALSDADSNSGVPNTTGHRWIALYSAEGGHTPPAYRGITTTGHWSQTTGNVPAQTAPNGVAIPPLNPQNGVSGNLPIGLFGDSETSVMKATITGTVHDLWQERFVAMFPNAVVSVINEGTGGLNTETALPSSTQLRAIGDTTKNAFANAVGDFNAANVKIIRIQLGTNDAAVDTHIAASEYLSNLQTIVNAFTAQVPSLKGIFVDEPPACIPDANPGWTNASNVLLRQYGAELTSLTGVTVGTGRIYDYSYNEGNYYFDNIHQQAPGLNTDPSTWAKGGQALAALAGLGLVTALTNAQGTTPAPTDPYRSDNATPVTILADYKPGAPNPFAGTGLGTFLLPTVVLTWINPANLLGGTIHIMRMNAGTSDPFVVVGTVAGADANTAPAQTYTDTTVLNGHRYTYTAFATPYGDTTTP